MSLAPFASDPSLSRGREFPLEAALALLDVAAGELSARCPDWPGGAAAAVRKRLSRARAERGAG